MTTTYDPGADSTPAYIKQARDSGRLTLDISDSACLCGCKDPTPGRFRPGHDARLKGRLLRAHLAKAGVTIIKDGKEDQMTARAYAKQVSSERHDWTEALDRATEKARSAAAALRAKAESDKIAVKKADEGAGTELVAESGESEKVTA